MKNHLKHLLLIAVLAIVGTASAVAQSTLRGKVVDAETGEPLIGATVSVGGINAATDIDGVFVVKGVKPDAPVSIQYIGFKTKTVKASPRSRGELGTVRLETDGRTLSDVIVTSQIAVARKTPVAVSSVPMSFIEEKIGTQEFPEILKSTPGVHANKEGGGYGDSEIYMRGFDNTNIAVMVNGVPMNDMENQKVYWSNWAGLTDVTRTMQTQRGLGASKVSAPSVGGTINIITKGLDAKKGGSIYYGMGNDNMNKVMFTVSTGMSKSGWAMTLLGSKTWGDGYAQGTDFKGYTYFVNISKRINEQHQLSFTAFGAPQEHYQRKGALTLADWKMTEQVWGVQNHKYNSSYGFDKNGQRRTAEYNVYHKPQLSLNHQWQINDKSSLSTVLYMSIGRGYGYSGQGNSTYGYSYTDWYGANYGTLQTKFRNADGTFNYGMIQDINEQSEHGSMLVMGKLKNYHNWYGLVSTYNTKIGKDFDFYGGVDFRAYKGVHTNEILDLYNGKYYIDSSRQNAKAVNNVNASNPDWVNEKLGVGDVMYRDYDGHVVQEGAFFQTEYTKSDLSAFIAGSLSNTSYWRYDRLYYDKKHAESKTKSYIGFTVKGGANYNFNEHHNVFFNAGYISRAPMFNNVFLTYTSSNVTNPDAKNEKVLSFEVGYGYRLKWLQVDLNAYWTKWMDKSMAKQLSVGAQQTDGYINMAGLDARHQGIELEVKASPLYWLDLNGMFSIGDWQWDSNAKGYIYDANGQPLDKDGNVASAPLAEDHYFAGIALKGIRVGGSAQTTAALGATVKIGKQIRIGADWTLYARNYAYYQVSSSNLTPGKTTTVADPWKAPTASQFDLNASYKFKLAGLNATISGNVNNLFDYQYLGKVWNPRSGAANKDNIYGFYAFGRTFSTRLKVNF
ncbi:TonB-dependent receptor [uncultured Prevotella sp.]|uniref:TonB-dependent receptor n=1 Tax=uncultured Prevotella sp. TaxID=159272 RepID=UPI002623F91D|nr:TonB-dependent receptor [uncultured Prevotella sp.]